MNASHNTWTPATQIIRTLVSDVKILGIDLYLGTLYVLAALLLGGGIYIAVLVLLIVMFYMAVRVCTPESRSPTVYFYASLPRCRLIAYWSHAGGLVTYCAVMEMIIAAVILLSDSTLAKENNLLLNPSLLIQPFVVIAMAMWAVYSVGNPLLKALLIFSLIVVANFFATNAAPPTGILIGWIGALFLLAVGTLLLLNAAKNWQKTQLGEIA